MIDGKKVPQSSEVELSGCSTQVPVPVGSGYSTYFFLQVCVVD
jgi:hypothetical protein